MHYQLPPGTPKNLKRVGEAAGDKLKSDSKSSAKSALANKTPTGMPAMRIRLENAAKTAQKVTPSGSTACSATHKTPGISLDVILDSPELFATPGNVF